MSATGIVTQRIGEYQYRVASEVGIDVEFIGHSISKESLTIGERVRIIDVYSGIDDMPRYGFARADSGLRGVIAIPDGQRGGFAEQSPANFAAAYVAYHAGKMRQFYDIARVMEVMDSSNLRVIMLTGDIPYLEAIVPCSGVFSGSFVRDDIALIRRGTDRSYVVGWWRPVAGPVVLKLTIRDTNGGTLIGLDPDIFGTWSYVDAQLYWYYDFGSGNYLNSGDEKEFERGKPVHLMAVPLGGEEGTYEFVEWTQANFAIEDKNLREQEWPAVINTNITLTYRRLPIKYMLGIKLTTRVIYEGVYEADVGESISLSAEEVIDFGEEYNYKFEFDYWEIYRDGVYGGNYKIEESVGAFSYSYTMPKEINNVIPYVAFCAIYKHVLKI